MKRPASSLEDRKTWLRHCSLFAELDDADLGAIAELAVLHGYGAAEIIFHGGTPAEGMHVVVDGLVKVLPLRSRRPRTGAPPVRKG